MKLVVGGLGGGPYYKYTALELCIVGLYGTIKILQEFILDKKAKTIIDRELPIPASKPWK